MPSTNRCVACHKDLPADARFCGFCGFRLQPSIDAREGASPSVGGGSGAHDRRAVGGQLAGASGGKQARADAVSGGRRVQRFPLKVEVSYNSDHNFFTGFLQNISSGGIFVATHDLLPLGSLVDVAFSLPGWKEPCIARCEVRWVRTQDAGEDGEPGMGLRFLNLRVDTAAAVDRFIQHREPIFFEE